MQAIITGMEERAKMMGIIVPEIKKWIDWIQKWFTKSEIPIITVEKTFLKKEETTPRRKYKNRSPNNRMKVRKTFRKKKFKKEFKNVLPK